jgi:hypothetical protein
MEYNYQTEYYLKIVALSRELGYNNSSVLRKELVALNALWQNTNQKRYELTRAAINHGLGEVRYKAIPGYKHGKPYNIYFVQEVIDFLERGIPLDIDYQYK